MDASTTLDGRPAGLAAPDPRQLGASALSEARIELMKAARFIDQVPAEYRAHQHVMAAVAQLDDALGDLAGEYPHSPKGRS